MASTKYVSGETSRQPAAGTMSRQSLSAATGITDQEVLSMLERVGFDSRAAALLWLMPLVRTLWSEESAYELERKRLLRFAVRKAKEDHDPAYSRLADYLAHKPSEEFFGVTLRALRLARWTHAALPQSG